MTALKAAQHSAAMAARIDECVQLTVPIARDEDRLTSHIGREIVVLVRDLALVSEIGPVALEEVLYLEFEDFRIGKDVVTDAVNAARRIVLHSRIERFLDTVEHGFLPFLYIERFK